MKEPLTYLFGHHKLKLLKFLLHNQGESFNPAELAKKTKVDIKLLQKELKEGMEAGIFTQKIKPKSKELLYTINPDLEVIKGIEPIIFELGDTFFKTIKEKIKLVGDIKVCILSGIFTKQLHSRVDLFVVADKMSTAKFNSFVEYVESELGKEIKFSCLELGEFTYRKNMFDKFVWSIIEDTHTIVLIDRVNIKR